jgi:hypothetical protein
MAKTTRATALQSFILGRERFAKISAVEGMRLSDTAQKEFEQDVKRRATPAQRRQRILAKYARKQ